MWRLFLFQTLQPFQIFPLWFVHVCFYRISIVWCTFAGHGLCAGCTTRLKRASNPTCPHCRVKIGKTDGNKLFIEFLDPAVPDSDDIVLSDSLSEGIAKQARHAKRCIDGLNANSSVNSARAVEKNLEQLGRALEDEEGPIVVSSQLDQCTRCLNHYHS